MARFWLTCVSTLVTVTDRAGNDALRVTNGAGDIAAGFLRGDAQGQEDGEQAKPERSLHSTLRCV